MKKGIISENQCTGAGEVYELRKKTGLSQTEFAKIIGVSLKSLKNYEQERREISHLKLMAIKMIVKDYLNGKKNEVK